MLELISSRTETVDEPRRGRFPVGSVWADSGIDILTPGNKPPPQLWRIISVSECGTGIMAVEYPEAKGAPITLFDRELKPYLRAV